MESWTGIAGAAIAFVVGLVVATYSRFIEHQLIRNRDREEVRQKIRLDALQELQDASRLSLNAALRAGRLISATLVQWQAEKTSGRADHADQMAEALSQVQLSLSRIGDSEIEELSKKLSGQVLLMSVKRDREDVDRRYAGATATYRELIELTGKHIRG